MSETISPHPTPRNRPPRTPDRRDGSELASFGNTPYSKGTASHHEEQFYTHKDIDDILRYDIANDKQVNLDLFLSIVLHTSNSHPPNEVEVVDGIIKSSEFTSLLEEYSKPVLNETEKYPRFTELCRYAVGQMVEKKITKNELGFMLCVNDPEYVRGSKSKRKPDMIGTTLEAVRARIRESRNGEKRSNGQTAQSQWTTKDASKVTLKEIIEKIKEPPNIPLMWSDLFMFVEFKVEDYDRADIVEPGPSQQLPSSAPSTSATRRPRKSNKQTVNSKFTKASNSYPPSTSSANCSHATSRGGSTASPSDSGVAGVSASYTSSRGRSTSSKRPRDNNSDNGLDRQSKRLKVTPVDVRVQCAGYAHHLFNQGGVRIHVIGMLVTDNILELLLYTRSGACSTEAFNFVDDPGRFLRILLAFSRLTLSQWGFFDRLIPCTLSVPQYPVCHGKTDACMFKGRTLDVAEYQFEVSDVRIFPRGLIGRGTWTMGIKAKSEELLDKAKVRELILKISGVATTRQAEKIFIEKARAAAIGDKKWVLDHLPDVLYSGEFEASVSFEQLFGEDYEKRTLRYLVMEELFPITDLADPEELRLAFKDIVQCHRWLVNVPGILHRDMSVNNFMYRLKGGRKYGVLNDFDLACTMEEDRQSTSKQRTGTKPFIAIELLTPAKGSRAPEKHFVRYDLESVVYVFAWIICRYQDGHELKRNLPFDGWCKGDWKSVAKEKSFWFSDTEPQTITPPYESLRPILESLRIQIRLGLNALSHHSSVAQVPHLAGRLLPFKQETLNDHVTYDTILTALDPPPSYTDATAPS